MAKAEMTVILKMDPTVKQLELLAETFADLAEHCLAGAQRLKTYTDSQAESDDVHEVGRE